MENFKKELELLINRHSMEGESNTPDFILATYLANCLAVFNQILRERERWHGRPIDGQAIMKTIAR